MVTVAGTTDADSIVVVGGITTSAQVNAMKLLHVPILSTERLAISAGHGADVIDVTAVDTADASFFVDAGDPTSNPPNSDTLIFRDGSGQARTRRQPGGGSDAGSIFLEYLRTTGQMTRIDYDNVELLQSG